MLAGAVSCSKANYIDLTKKAHLAECPNYSIGKIVNGYYNTTNWVAYRTDDEDMIRVTATGEVLVAGAYTDAELEFFFRESTGEATLNTVRFDGEPQLRPFAEALISNMCEKARES